MEYLSSPGLIHIEVILHTSYISARVKATRVPRSSKEIKKKVSLVCYIFSNILKTKSWFSLFYVYELFIYFAIISLVNTKYLQPLPVLVSILNDFHILPIFQLMEKRQKHCQ